MCKSLKRAQEIYFKKDVRDRNYKNKSKVDKTIYNTDLACAYL